MNSLCSDRQWSIEDVSKLKESMFISGIREKSFTMRIVNKS